MEINFTCFVEHFKMQLMRYFELHTYLVSNFIGQQRSKSPSKRVTKVHQGWGSCRPKVLIAMSWGDVGTGQICLSLRKNYSSLAATCTPGLINHVLCCPNPSCSRITALGIFLCRCAEGILEAQTFLHLEVPVKLLVYLAFCSTHSPQ